eukprot:3185717-Pleurochrysis_carterae.AAC.2
MSALATTLQRETARERGRSSAPAATSYCGRRPCCPGGLCAFSDPALRWRWQPQRSCVTLPLEPRQHIVLAIEVQLAAMQGDRSQQIAACD